jgi:hypothetical protein
MRLKRPPAGCASWSTGRDRAVSVTVSRYVNAHPPDYGRRFSTTFLAARPTVSTVPTDDNRAMPGRLTIGVFVIVIALIVLVLAAQKIPHAKRPTILHPRIVTTTITNSPHADAPWQYAQPAQPTPLRL